MNTTTLREELSDWIIESLTDHTTGDAPDVELDMDFPGGERGFLVGPIPEGTSEPEGGMRTRVIDVRLSFPPYTRPRALRDVGEGLKACLERDPHLGGRLHPDLVRYHELHVEPGKGSYGEGSGLVTVTIAHEQSE